MTDIIQTLVEACIKEVTRVGMNPEPGEPLTLSRAVKISRAVLKSGGNDLVETVVQRFQKPRLGENANANLEACVAVVIGVIQPGLEKIVARRFIDIDAINLVSLVDQNIEAIAAVLRNEYIGLDPWRFQRILDTMKRVSIWSDRVFEGGGRNDVRLLGVSMQKLHYHLTCHESIGLIVRIKSYTDLLLDVSLFCGLVGSEEFSSAATETQGRKQIRGKPKYLRLENYADVKRWFASARLVDV
jgi:hypothetical protein